MPEIERRQFLKLASALVLPPRCYARDGRIYLPNCDDLFREITSDMTKDGIYNLNGQLEPGLPTHDLQFFNPGNYLLENIMSMNNEYSNWRKEESSKKWGYDPNDFSGTMAGPSKAYVGATAWIQNQDNERIVGPLLIVESIAPIHMRARFCEYGGGTDIDQNSYDFLGASLNSVKIILKATTDLVQPDFNIEGYIPFAETWLQADGWEC